MHLIDVILTIYTHYVQFAFKSLHLLKVEVECLDLHDVLGVFLSNH